MHYLEAAEGVDPASGIVAGVITGVIVTLVTATIVPFITTQFSLWSERRAAIVAARRSAHDAYREATVRAQMRHLATFPHGGVAYDRHVQNDEERQAAIERFSAQFALGDAAVYDAWVMNPNTSTTSQMLSSWANGQNLRAWVAARKLLKQHDQQTVNSPEHHDPQETDPVPEEERP